MRIIGHPPFATRDQSDGERGRYVLRARPAEDRGIESNAPERIGDFHHRLMALTQKLNESGNTHAATGDQDARELVRVLVLDVHDRTIDAGRDLFPDLAHDGVQIKLDLLFAMHGCLCLSLAQVEPALHRFDEVHTADREILGIKRRATSNDVDVGQLRAHVHQRHHLFRSKVVVHADRVLNRERLDVEHAGVEARFANQIGVGHQHFALGRHEQDLHLLGVRAAVKNLKIEAHFVDVVGNVLLGFPLDGFARVLGRHAVHSDLLHDHRATRNRGCDVLDLEMLGFKEVLNRFHDELAVHDLAVHDRFRQQGGRAEAF